jgi:hypothetical protein
MDSFYPDNKKEKKDIHDILVSDILKFGNDPIIANEDRIISARKSSEFTLLNLGHL